ncbi:relaxase/mobilization nuclease domain-containing protein [Pseudochryseolinea flava]|uniref:MobA/VirD2-like nuclease domain-containing protein n=1 Tax=Pseudochryseolinea flava TaxID=2059302 RepID=A0A364Y5M4_9BACT|nr:relaxase/mobilization nuclease domain-containing protein [Pseudochryseolinea flava]RAW01525.1 hypothetical protein DQQ10_07650 [Pseudochryseolinea flava]
MVAKVITGKSMRGVLSYNEHKVRDGMASCIHAENFGLDSGEMTFRMKLNRFEQLMALNKRTKTNVVHVSLNFAVNEILDQDRLIEIGRMYMEHLGFADQPYLIYEHFDAAHQHIHIATTNIRGDGSRIPLHNIGKNVSEPARKYVEEFFGLVQAEQQAKHEKLIFPTRIDPIQYGKHETKRSISNVVNYVTRNYQYTSIAGLNAALKQFNVVAYQGEPGTAMYERGGLQYSIIDVNGNRVGVPIKASSIHGKPTLKFLKGQFVLGEKLRLSHAQSLRDKIATAMGVSKSFQQLIEVLAQKNVVLLPRLSVDGKVFGMTFVDNESKVVFKGSDLGKQYSAANILKSFGPVPLSEGVLKDESKRSYDVEVPVAIHGTPGFDHAIEMLMKSQSSVDGVPAVDRRRRKRKKRIKR